LDNIQVVVQRAINSLEQFLPMASHFNADFLVRYHLDFLTVHEAGKDVDIQLHLLGGQISRLQMAWQWLTPDMPDDAAEIHLALLQDQLRTLLMTVAKLKKKAFFLDKVLDILIVKAQACEAALANYVAALPAEAQIIMTGTDGEESSLKIFGTGQKGQAAQTSLLKLDNVLANLQELYGSTVTLQNTAIAVNEKTSDAQRHLAEERQMTNVRAAEFYHRHLTSDMMELLSWNGILPTNNLVPEKYRNGPDPVERFLQQSGDGPGSGKMTSLHDQLVRAIGLTSLSGNTDMQSAAILDILRRR
jgi:hypothetical protein